MGYGHIAAALALVACAMAFIMGVYIGRYVR